MSDFSIDSHKLMYHPHEVSDWLYGGDIHPIYVEISPVGHCNHRCQFCAVDYLGYKPNSLSVNRLDLTFQFMENRVKSVMFAGEGEPLLHKHINEIVDSANNHNLDVSFTTNGTLLDKLTPESLNKTSWIKVSCNAGNSEDYQRIHKSHKGDWDKVWTNLANVLGHKIKTNIKLRVGVQAVVLPDNIDGLSGLVKNAKTLGLDYVVFKPYSQHLRSITKEYKDIKYKDMMIALDILANESDKVTKVIVRQNAMESWDRPDRGYTKCYSTPHFWAYIMATGDVYACSAYLGDERFKLGNINDQLWNSIWLSDKRNQLKKTMECLDIKECRKNCRMHQVNQYLWDIKHPVEHKNFI